MRASLLLNSMMGKLYLKQINYNNYNQKYIEYKKKKLHKNHMTNIFKVIFN